MDSEFYSVNEVAKILGLSRDRVYEYVRRGNIHGTRITGNSAWRIHKSEIERMRVAGGQVTTPPEGSEQEGQPLPVDTGGTSPDRGGHRPADGGGEATESPQDRPTGTAQPVACTAPPDAISVAWLRAHRVPKKLAPDILLRWRDGHRCGQHEVCRASMMLVEDLASGVPPSRAEAMYRLGLKAAQMDIVEALRHLESSRLYEIWSGKENYAAFMAETGNARSNPGHQSGQK